jgi:hypothetical protein
LCAPVLAQQSDTLSAEASNPEKMGWMKGAPPPSEKLIRFTDTDFLRSQNYAGPFVTSVN